MDAYEQFKIFLALLSTLFFGAAYIQYVLDILYYDAQQLAAMVGFYLSSASLVYLTGLYRAGLAVFNHVLIIPLVQKMLTEKAAKYEQQIALLTQQNDALQAQHSADTTETGKLKSESRALQLKLSIEADERANSDYQHSRELKRKTYAISSLQQDIHRAESKAAPQPAMSQLLYPNRAYGPTPPTKKLSDNQELADARKDRNAAILEQHRARVAAEEHESAISRLDNQRRRLLEREERLEAQAGSSKEELREASKAQAALRAQIRGLQRERELNGERTQQQLERQRAAMRQEMHLA